MKWIDVNKQLPPDNDWREEYLVTVLCGNVTTTLCMDWECETVRKKKVKRWKWKDRLVIYNWKVTHWMKFPKPADKKEVVG